MVRDSELKKKSAFRKTLKMQIILDVIKPHDVNTC